MLVSSIERQSGPNPAEESGGDATDTCVSYGSGMVGRGWARFTSEAANTDQPTDQDRFMSPYSRFTGPIALLTLALATACSEESDPVTQPAGGVLPAAVETRTIPAIQGASHVSPFAGAKVSTAGIVTAVAFNGFYLQDPAGDGNPATSDAIFVFTSTRPTLQVGDSVRVTGLVSEFVPGGSATGNLSTTQISRVSAADPLVIEPVSSDNPLPDPVVIGRGGRVPPAEFVISPSEIGTPIDLRVPATAPATPFNPETDGIDFFESLEAMRVLVQDPVAVSPTRTFSAVSSELFTLVDGGKDALPKENLTKRGGILLGADPANRGDQQPERVQVQFDGTLYPGNVPAVAVGDRLSSVVGVMGYNFGNFEVNATETVQVSPAGLQAETTELRGDAHNLTVANYNVLNLSADASDDIQRSLLAAEIVNRLRAPDIIALQEIQDNNGEQGGAANTETDASQTLGRLADAVGRAGGPAYAFADVAPAANTSGGVPGGNIRVSFLYRPDRVALIGLQSVTPEVLTGIGSADPTAFTDSRNPLAGTFEFAGERITVISNHWSSRSGSTPIFGAIQPFVQVAEAAREAQARAVHDYVASLLAADPAGRVIVSGDLNTFEWTDDLTQLLPGSNRILTDLLTELKGGEPYSFIFDGTAQLLDHMFATANLLQGAEFDVVHVNTDFPHLLGQVVASDHDPVMARLRIP
jgi:predicted extracellular nuclease